MQTYPAEKLPQVVSDTTEGVRNDALVSANVCVCVCVCYMDTGCWVVCVVKCE